METSKESEMSSKTAIYINALSEAPGHIVAFFVVAIPLCILALVVAILISANWDAITTTAKSFSGGTKDDIITYIVSWVLLLVLSFASSLQLKEILESRLNDRPRLRANQIAIMIALVLIIFLFKQPFLNELFSGKDSSAMLKGLLIGGGITSSWLVW